MTRPLFEQYKEALRRGHLAARAEDLEAAVAAYREAARLAPDRAAPHTSIAGVLHRAGRRDDALAAFDRALDVAPDDEATLRARALAFEDMGRLASAAADYEQLAESLEAAGRRDDALAPARRAVELAATGARRRLLARLEAPESEVPLPPRTTLAPRRIGTPEAPPRRPRPEPAPETAVPIDAATETGPPVDLAPEPTPAEVPAAPEVPLATGIPDAAAVSAVPDVPEVIGAAVEPATATGADAAAPEREAVEPAAEAPAELPQAAEPSPAAEPLQTAEPAAPGARFPDDVAFDAPLPPLIQLDVEEGPAIEWPAIDLPSAPPPPIVGPPPDAQVLVAEANAFIDAGDPAGARNLLLTAVMVHRAAGRSDAALDVCLQLLALAPGDPHVHLAIAALQLDRGWRGLATEKLDLLLRLTSLTGDTQAEADVRALAAERVRDEPPPSYAGA